ncbi:MAG: hypothetical protein JWO15_112 [Sphingomonadales bacterium]|nr:hypothetical protein [Sphingomonadales bacterium]
MNIENIQHVVEPHPEAPRPRMRRSTLMCGIGAGLLMFGGFVETVTAAEWLNQRIGGVLVFAVGLGIAPPILRRLRDKVKLLRPRWVPVILFLAIGPVASLVTLPLVPSAAKQAEIKAHAVQDAKIKLKAGDASGASAAMSHFRFSDDRDPVVLAILQDIDAAQKSVAPAPAKAIPTEQPAVTTANAAAQEVPQSAEANFAERVETYWIPAAQKLDTAEPSSDEEYTGRLNAIDELARDLQDGAALKLDIKQKATRARFMSILSAKQRAIFPVLRRHYREVVGGNLFKADIDMAIVGAGSTVVKLTSGMFSLGSNVADAEETMSPALRRLRFKRLEFRWSRYLNDGYHYDLKAPADGDIGIWDAGASSFQKIAR